MKQLSDEFGDDLAVIAFPTGEFGGQELPTDEAIAKFAYDRVKFPAAPRGVLYRRRTSAAPRGRPCRRGGAAPGVELQGKFLVSRDGAVTDASGVDDIAAAVKALL
ncbi:glutathione peroxidase [Aureococcus anophagefferens]|nr:glutathione peroxidase [Aureococcus anophagefferens]